MAVGGTRGNDKARGANLAKPRFEILRSSLKCCRVAVRPIFVHVRFTVDIFVNLCMMSSATKPTYSPAQMYGAPRHFAREQCAQFLRGHCASVMPVKQPRTLSVNVGTFAGPPQLGEPAHPRPLRFFNPSLTAAPHGLCPRCVYVVAVRADVLHQCDASSPLFNATWKKMTIATAAFFKGTVLLVLDEKWRSLIGRGSSHDHRCR